MPNIIIPIAPGSEEMEAVICIDIFRRAGWNVSVVTFETEKQVTASRGVNLVADHYWSEINPNDYDIIIIPGGNGGTETLAAEPELLATLQTFDQAGKTIGAICAAARVLDAAAILRQRRYTCYPGVEAKITSGVHSTDTVVQHENLITSQGPGTAFDFALAVVASVETPEHAETLRQQMVLTR